MQSHKSNSTIGNADYANTTPLPPSLPDITLDSYLTLQVTTWAPLPLDSRIFQTPSLTQYAPIYSTTAPETIYQASVFGRWHANTQNIGGHIKENYIYFVPGASWTPNPFIGYLKNPYGFHLTSFSATPISYTDNTGIPKEKTAMLRTYVFTGPNALREAKL